MGLQKNDMKALTPLLAFSGAAIFAVGCSSSGNAVTSLHTGGQLKRGQAAMIAASGLPVDYKDFMKILAQTPPGLRRQFVMSNRNNIARLTPSEKEQFQQIMRSSTRG